ncbi:alpha-12-mannosyltransferase (Mnn2) protein [Rutstroemia sp. NJR-2017a BVV2]|nr:alpha-12-mannosyltransferase (Mnn2) protein [Rutstroemia sp. NJR-2017a BVV2]
MLYPAPILVNRRFTTVLPILLIVLLGLSLEYRYSYLGTQTLFPKFGHSKLPWSNPSSGFWASFAPLLAAAAPRCPPPQLDGRAYSSNRISARRAANHIVMNETDVESMRRSHSWFVDQLKHQTPALEFEDGTQGIVTSAGGKYFPPLIVSLQFLRRTGSTLPVEVFLARPDEYEPLICETILPSLNAKCIVLSEIIDQYSLPFVFEGYQLKVFSILFSSFESVLFLDADNFPIYSPDELFVSEPFKSQHLVLWPDYWSSTVSSLLNQVVGLDESLLNSRPTIEAGQILVNKRHHTDSLLLAAYYNCYGEYYYHLMTQGGAGEGDKETFAVAPLVLGKSFYTVSEPPRPLGQRGNGAAVLQADPIEDSASDPEHIPRPFFIHASWPPKLNALYNYQGSRQWGTEDHSMAMFNLDVERIAWGYMVEMACNEDIIFESWGNKTEKGVCNQTMESYTTMFGSEYGIEQPITR